VKKQFESICNRLPRGCYIQRGMKNRDFRPVSRFVSETIQDVTIVTMEDERVRDLSNDAIFNDFE